MPEILFKAKRIDNGEWAEGHYVKTGEASYIVVPYLQADISGAEGRNIEVDPSTICQYTGILDKNGNKIWENDIIADKHYKYSVVWDEEEGSWMLETISRARYGLAGIGRINSEKFEVIGNIFDKKELLERE